MRPKTFFLTLVKTFSSAAYYAEIIKAKWTFSLRFFLMSYIVLGLIGAAAFVLIDAPRYEKAIGQDLVQLQQNFPAKLEISWNGQTLAVSPNQEIVLPYPSLLAGQKDNLPKTFGVIDTRIQQPTEETDKENQNSLFFVTATKLFLSAGPQQWSDLPLGSVPGFEKNFTLNAKTLPGYISNWQNLIHQSIGMAALLQFLFLTPLLIIGRLLFILFYGAIIFYILRFSSSRMRYSQIVQICLHVSVVAETVNLITTHLTQTSLPMFSFAFWGYLLFVLFSLRSVKISPTKPQK